MKYIHASNVDKMPWMKAKWMHDEILDELDARNKKFEEKLNAGIPEY